MAVDNQGYSYPNIAELVEDMSDRAKSLFGQAMDTNVDSYMGHLIGVSSIEIVKAFEDIAEVVSNMNANTSEGLMLENICLLSGIIKRAKAFGSGIIEFQGPQGTYIPIGFVIVSSTNPAYRFVTQTENTIGSTGILRTKVIAESTGNWDVPIGELTEIEVPLTGLTAINRAAMSPGTDDVESDDNLRSRRNRTLSIGGNGTPAAIRASLEQLPGVTAAIVIQNNSHSARPRVGSDYERPPNSLECVVEGGNDYDIIETIALTTSGTSALFGLLTAYYEDPTGNPHQIRFSRPDVLEGQIQVSFSPYTEEVLPEDAYTLVTNAILEFAEQEYTLGKDFLVDRIMCPIVSVPGIGDVDIQIGVKNYRPISPNNIIVENYQKVKILSENITITQI